MTLAGFKRISDGCIDDTPLLAIETPTPLRVRMSMEERSARSTRVIVVGNEKGGSGKSTVAMHVAVALLKADQSVATVDLDIGQKTFTHYIENRRTWGERVARDFGTPEHVVLDGPLDGDQTETCTAFADAIARLSESHNFIVVDTPGRGGKLTRLAHLMADTLVTPLNDSFVDFDVLGVVDPETFAVSGISHYAMMVEEVRNERRLLGREPMDWIVMRNRLSVLGTRNKRLVGSALRDLSGRLDFRAIDGFAERMIFREFFSRGLTALDDLDQVTLGTRPTMSHATARQEVATLLNSMNLGAFINGLTRDIPGVEIATGDRHAA
jgi:chromosome partitioning protein